VRVPRSLLLALALLFAAGSTFYSLAWIYYIRLQPDVQLGITYVPDPDQLDAIRLRSVVPDSPAARAGLQADDLILAVNGETGELRRVLSTMLGEARPGDTIRLRVAREGWHAPRPIEARLQPRTAANGALRLPERVAAEIVSFYPLPFLIVGIAVLLQRPDDRYAWLLALVFTGFICAAPLWQFEPRIHRSIAPFMFAWWGMFVSLLPALFYWFFARFPSPSPLDRRAPWLKYVLLVVGLTVGVFVSALGAFGGPRAVERLFGTLAVGTLGGLPPLVWGVIAYNLTGQALGITSGVMNAFGPPEVRRKVRVIMAGSLVGLAPVATVQTYAAIRGIAVEQLPTIVWTGAVMALFMMPFSFAYAVVKHRVLEIPVLIRRSARYLLVRRGLVTLTGLGVLAMTFVFARAIGTLFGEAGASTAPISLVAGAVFGIALASAGGRLLRNATARIDRAFFRSAYDVRRILQALAEQSRTVTDRTALAGLLAGSLNEALHPSSLCIFIRDDAGDFVRCDPDGAAGTRLDASVLASLNLPEDGVRAVEPREQAATVLAPVLGEPPELVAVMQGRDEDVEGLILLGPRLAEEPYSGEDQELIAAVGTQAGVTLENIRLAESMAARMEAERSAARELEIAREVQLKLLPQKAPALATLDCAGICLQARAVGGDYYDFLDLGPGRVGLVLADISGKGISAALLMASLQANLRGQYAQTSADLVRVLYSLNRIFYDSTAPSHYATLFFGIYDEDTRRLQYANCGHLPPALRRADGTLERLDGTAPVVGLFDEWTCASREIVLDAGDSLVIFSDGVTDALNDAGEEFGEDRLLEVIEAHPADAAAPLMRTIVDHVTAYASATPFDDLTLMVATGRR
jgi:phosphoserine phosphatase RsbU/P